MIKKEGHGWRIITDSSRDRFSTLIGGECWAIELNESEWEILVRLVVDLSNQYIDIKDQLMGDENITLELGRSPWFAILKGDKNGWDLKLILTPSDSVNRGAEIFWPRNVTMFVTNAMRTMWDCGYL
ncbi:DUF1818 family protein [Prochlorococcus marinus]|uniref:DUF1818 domain-containing protein n=1 Tax=Prochlorococcus marinus XMU1408 TaxID=2213228 RepID=A0A318R1E5_PROMR|nr:DUF1818 family protein [Prochlorococcus marinus]MBW3042606.1 DUF1818 domain-containing protein [Prochlorococcus marinus str. XMU1408]PYE01303.1 DUF1818 domain-containing protein [Prochlorococcus marinus XMU1408]